MLIVGSKFKVIDGTGVLEVRCIKVLRTATRKEIRVGDLLVVVVTIYTLKAGFLRDKKKKIRFLSGTKHRALVVRTRFKYRRGRVATFRFGDNAVILINKRKSPIGRRFRGPLLLEVYDKYPVLGCLTRNAV